MPLKRLNPRTQALSQRINPLAAPPRGAVYGTPEWEAARRAALQRAGWKCCMCSVRAPARLFVDHKREVKDGGALYDQDNLQVLCGRHHTLKTNVARRQRSGLLR